MKRLPPFKEFDDDRQLTRLERIVILGMVGCSLLALAGAWGGW